MQWYSRLNPPGFSATGHKQVQSSVVDFNVEMFHVANVKNIKYSIHIRSVVILSHFDNNGGVGAYCQSVGNSLRNVIIYSI